MIVPFIIGGVILPIALTIFYALEQHDKTERARQGLPPKKYHDLTDIDVTFTDTLGDRRR